MRLDDLLNKPLKECLDECSMGKMNPITDDKGNVIKIIIEYIPNNNIVRR